MYVIRFTILAIALFISTVDAVLAQYNPKSYRTLNVLDGLPQAFVSGIVQDSKGFMWIGTRDGLARYDGRNFKAFRYDSDDSLTIAANIITKIHIDRDDLLWINYENGELDILDTDTERITHLSALPAYQLLRDNLKTSNTIVQDSLGRHWILGKRGEIFIVDLHQGRLTRHTAENLFPALGENEITGMAHTGSDILLILDHSMVYVDTYLKVKKHITFSFENPHLYDPVRDWKDTSPAIRSNGDIIFQDHDRLIFFDGELEQFAVFPLPPRRFYGLPNLLKDALENIIIAHHNHTYYFDRANRLIIVDEGLESDLYVKSAIYLDRSGVLWEGSNGYGIKQFDINLTQMPSQNYTLDFPSDMLRGLGITNTTIEKTFLYRVNPYFFRWVSGHDGKIWFAKAGADTVHEPNLLLYQDGAIRQQRFTYVNHSPEPNQGIDALALTPAGRLWGLDHLFRPVKFDTDRRAATVYQPVKHGYSPDKLTEINGMAMDDEDTFWICTSLGLMRYDLKTGSVKHFFHADPAMHLLTIRQDPLDRHILWLGTYADGIIRFDKRNGTYKHFKVRDGLPNNTVYAIVPGQDGLLWCSSNKGIFSFNPAKSKADSYIPQGISPLIECNRFHYFAFPNGTLAFGGTDAYTHFSPQDMREDSFEPNIELTGIAINNIQTHYGDATFPFEQPIHALQSLQLPYDQNFLSFEFAALQFNAPEKLQYRYKLEGFDKDWVLAGNKNVATYTGLPPGKYTLHVNASNTSGKWSNHVKTLDLVISPPFWRTWWFTVISVLAIGSLVSFIISQRWRAIRKKDQQRLDFARETMELEARALRSQMNPHFIFNCLNSIKSLIQQGENQAAATYLTTFSRLIRNQLSNTQKEISLQEELDTCKLYLEMEALRFGNKLTYTFTAASSLNLALIRVPPLIIQPFVENAIIHGILPKDNGGKVTISVYQKNDGVVCHIDDDGIGRRQSELLQLRRKPLHRSKGMTLVAHRLKLHNALNRYNIDISVHDKLDNRQLPTGTCVSLTFKSSSI